LSVKNAKPGRHADGEGLYLLVKPTGAKSWLLRIQVDGRRRDIGLGTVDTSPRALGKGEQSPIAIPILHRKVLSLSEAREKAGMLRTAAKSGLDPIAERDRERRVIPTFREAVEAAHEALKDGWSDKGAKNFLTSLERHAYPRIGDRRVEGITAGDITAVLAPIWTAKPDMARKVRQRIGAVLNFSHGRGWRTVEAPSKSVTVGLPRQPKGGNYDSMPYADVPAFVASLLTAAPTTGRLALIFQILTAARPGEVRAARWGHIDLKARHWNRPADLMKTGVAHTVTLNDAALAVLQQAKAAHHPAADTLIFPGRGSGMFSDMTLNKVLRDAKQPFDAHGFRSSFRNWAAEQMHHLDDSVAEAAIAHVIKDAVVRAYKRTPLLELRRQLLGAWGEFVIPEADGDANKQTCG
jgi:integrase